MSAAEDIRAIAHGWQQHPPAESFTVDPTAVADLYALILGEPAPTSFVDAAAAHHPNAVGAANHLGEIIDQATYQAMVAARDQLAAGQPAAAEDLYRQVADVGRVGRAPARQADAVSLLARSLRHRRRPTEAAQYAQEAAAIASDAGLRPQLSLALDELGLARMEAGDPRGAVDAFAGAMQHAGDDAKTPIATNWARAYTSMSRLHEARSIMEQTIERLDRLGASNGLGEAHDALAQTLAQLGRYDDALAESAAARSCFADGHPMRRLVNALTEADIRVAAGHDATNAFGRAMAAADEVAEAVVDRRRREAAIRRAIASALPPDHPIREGYADALRRRAQGDLDGAAHRLVEVARAAGDAGDTETSLRAQGTLIAVLREHGKPGPALSMASALLADARTAGSALAEAMALDAVGLGQPGPGGRLADLVVMRALRTLHDDVVGAEAPESLVAHLRSQGFGTIEHELALLCHEYGDLERAEGFARAALRAFAGAAAPESEVNRWIGLASILAARGADGSADELARLTSSIAEFARTTTSRRARIMAEEHLARWHRADDPARALAHAQAATALIDDELHGLTGSDRTDARRRFADAFGVLGLLYLDADRPAEAFAAFNERKGRTIADHHSPSIARTDVAALQDRLAGTDDAVVDLVLTDDRIISIVVSTGDVSWLAVPFDAHRLDPLIRTDMGDRADTALALVATDEALAAVARHVVDTTHPDGRLTIVPDAVLHNVPVHAIPVDGRRLDEHRPVGYAVGAGTLLGEARRRTGRSLVIGDTAGDLPGARAEASAVAARLGVTPLLGLDATVSTLRERLVAEDPDIVHVAVHGTTDAVHGGRSAIKLATDDGATTWVPFADLARLDWSARLVVFSGCSTGASGVDVRRELVGVARAALESGAGAVIGSLWPVRDDLAQRYMTLFYEAITPLPRDEPIDLRVVMAQVSATMAAEPATGVGPSRDDWPTRTPAVDVEHGSAAFVLIGDPLLRPDHPPGRPEEA